MHTDQQLKNVFDSTVDGLPPQVFRDPPISLTGGNETTIYAFSFDVADEHPFSGPLIVRIFDKTSGESQQYLWEAATHEVLAEEGYPVPRILLASDHPGLGAPWLIMERIPGSMLVGDALEMPWGVFKFASVFVSLPVLLAELHRKLHEMDPHKLQVALAARFFDSGGVYAPPGPGRPGPRPRRRRSR